VTAVPAWFQNLSIASLALGVLCSVVVAVDVIRRPQQMWIMNIVWPVTALVGAVWILRQYFLYGRLAERPCFNEARQKGGEPPSKQLVPFPFMVTNATPHCGSRCTLGDIVSE
jgi:hypothetical protein